MRLLVLECDGISTIFQDVQNWVVLENINVFFRRKENFLKVTKCGNFALECVSNENIS